MYLVRELQSIFSLGIELPTNPDAPRRRILFGIAPTIPFTTKSY